MADLTLGIQAEDEGAGKTLEQLERQVEDLTRQVGKLTKKPIEIPTDPAVEDLKKLEAALKRAERQFDRAKEAVDDAQKEFDQFGGSTKKLENAQKRLALASQKLVAIVRKLPPSLRTTSQELDAVEKQAEQAAAAFKRLETTGKGVSSLVRSIGQLRTGMAAFVAVLGVAQIARAAQGLAEYGKEAIATKRTFDALIPSLRGITGSTDLAGESYAFLEDISKRLKVQTSGLIKPYIALTAALRAQNESLNDVDEVFDAIITSGAAFGKTQAEISLALNGVSQAVSKGVASMEEFRRQIGEQIPNAIPALAKGLGVTIPEAIAQVSSGSLNGAKAVKAMAEGLQELNSAAALGQLGTVGKGIDDVARIAENAERAFADGLEPALLATIAQMQAFEKESQAFATLVGASLSEATTQAIGFFETFQDLTSQADKGSQTTIDFVNGIAAAIRSVTGLDLSEPLRKFGEDLTGLSSAAEATFKKLSDDAKEAAVGAAESARDTEERFRKAFQEISEAAGLSAGERQAIESELVKAIAKISEDGAKKRATLETLILEAAQATGEQRIVLETRVGAELRRIAREDEAARVKTLEQFRKAAEDAARARIAAEAAAAKEIAEFLDGVVAKARATGEERAAADAANADKIAQIEANLQEKIQELRDQAAADLLKPKVDRAKVAEELAEKIIEVERSAAEKVRAELERVAAAAEAAAERRIAAEKKIQEQIDKSVEALGKLFEATQQGEGDEAESPFSKFRDDAEAVTDELGAIKLAIDSLKKTDDPFGGLDFSDLEGVLGAAGESLFDFGQGFDNITEEAGEFANKTDELTSALDRFLASGGAAFSQLPVDAQGAVRDILSQYAELAAGNQATQQDLQSFVGAIQQVFSDAGQAIGDPIDAIKNKIQELGESQQESADQAEQAGEAQAKAGEGAAVAWDPVTKTLTTVKEATEAVGDASEETATRVEEAGGKILTTNQALEDAGPAAKQAAEGLTEMGTAGQEAATGIQAAADGAEGLKGDLIGEEEPTKLRDLGVAASEAAASIVPLAPPLESIAAASVSIGESLPLWSSQLPAVAESAERILSLLSDKPVDLAALSAAIGELAESTGPLGANLGIIQTAIAGMPESLGQAREHFEVLFPLAAEAAGDDRFGVIGSGLAAIGAALPPIPEPLERVGKVLSEINSEQSAIIAALNGIAAGLGKVGSEEVLQTLVSLGDQLQALLALIAEIDETTASWSKTVQQLIDDIPNLLFELTGLANAILNELSPALDRLVEDGEATKIKLEELQTAFGETADAAVDMANRGGQAVEGLTLKLTAAKEEALALAEALREAAKAAAEVNAIS